MSTQVPPIVPQPPRDSFPPARAAQLQVGRLRVVLHKTARVANDGLVHGLPPNLGIFPIFAAKDFPGQVPPEWEENALFIAIQNNEAMWMSFSRAGNGNSWIPGWRNEWRNHPVAAIVGAGGINCLTGEKLASTLEEDGYMVVPPQPWLDGWKNQKGAVYQFVGTEYQKGEGKTVGEQLLGAESKTGAIGIASYDPKPGASVPEVATPDHYAEGGIVAFSKAAIPPFAPAGVKYSADFAAADLEIEPFLRRCTMPMSEMGLGKGGQISQKIYPDPYGREVWSDTAAARVALYLVSAEQFA